MENDKKTDFILENNEHINLEKWLKECFNQVIFSFLKDNIIFIILSVALAYLVIICVVPLDSLVYTKLEYIKVNRENYIWIFSIVVFAIMYISIFIIKKIYFKYKSISKKENYEIYEKEINRLWSEVEKLTSLEYGLIINFLNTGNTPYYLENKNLENKLLSSDWVYKKEFSMLDSSDRNYIRDTEYEYNYNNPIYKYMLKEDIYNILKYSMEKYGKISHFER